MRANTENKSMDIEVRDINYILSSYMISYLFISKNEYPDKVIFPMFRGIPRPLKPGVMIPIEYVPDDSPIAVEIQEDGSNVAEATTREIDEIDAKEEEISRLKTEIKRLTEGEPEQPLTPSPEDLIRAAEEEAQQAVDEAGDKVLEIETEHPSAAQLAFASDSVTVATPHQLTDREPKLPPGPQLPPGTPLDNMPPRDRADQARVAKDLAVQPDINENEEKPFEKEIVKDDKGNPTVLEEVKPDDFSGQ